MRTYGPAPSTTSAAPSTALRRLSLALMTITLQDLEQRLVAAANALVGPVDPADFKTYVFPMLFWDQ